jgi:phosphoserine aminotransferase
MARIYNFSAGPAILPEPVLQQAQKDLWDMKGTGIGVMECSHRTKVYEGIVTSARNRLKELLRLGPDHEVVFLQGGASTQFFMLPQNLLGQGKRATYLETGHWAKKAIEEARRFGTIDIPWTSKATNFDRVPKQGEWGPLPDGTVYLHYTSNNTIFGTEMDYIPDAGDALLVCDASSDILSRDLDGSKIDVLYAGAQKNLGPSGVTVVALSKRALAACEQNLPTMLRYQVHIDNDSMYNTPNTWGIYIIDEVCGWILQQGGMKAVEARNRAQAEAVYGAIDGSDGFWRGTCQKDSRSWMNLTFTSGDAELDTAFVKKAEAAGLSGLKGHRAVGGLRASLYNAQTDAAVEALVGFMGEFARSNRKG